MPTVANRTSEPQPGVYRRAVELKNIKVSILTKALIHEFGAGNVKLERTAVDRCMIVSEKPLREEDVERVIRESSKPLGELNGNEVTRTRVAPNTVESRDALGNKENETQNPFQRAPTFAQIIRKSTLRWFTKKEQSSNERAS